DWLGLGLLLRSGPGLGCVYLCAHVCVCYVFACVCVCVLIKSVSLVSDSLGNALNAIRVSTELIEEELRPHLDTLLTIAQERSKWQTHTHTHHRHTQHIPIYITTYI